MQVQLKTRHWHLRPVVLLIVLKGPQSVKTAQVKIKSLTNIAEKFRKAVEKAVITVENRVHDAILT